VNVDILKEVEVVTVYDGERDYTNGDIKGQV